MAAAKKGLQDHSVTTLALCHRGQQLFHSDGGKRGGVVGHRVGDDEVVLMDGQIKGVGHLFQFPHGLHAPNFFVANFFV